MRGKFTFNNIASMQVKKGIRDVVHYSILLCNNFTFVGEFICTRRESLPQKRRLLYFMPMPCLVTALVLCVLLSLPRSSHGDIVLTRVSQKASFMIIIAT